MDKITFSVKRQQLGRYQDIHLLVAGFLVLGWLLLLMGFRKAHLLWAESLEYHMDDDTLSVTSCFTLWGLVMSRQEKRIPLSKITDVKLVQGPILNRMDLWQLHIQTASTGQRFPEAVLHALETPHETRDQILAAIKG